MMTLKLVLLALWAAANAVAFTLMGVDKRRARRGQWRIRERTLFGAAICFGALGGTLGMFCFHHKTKHWYFRIGFPALLAAQVVLILWTLARIS